MFHDHPPIHHGVNLAIASFPFVSWFSHFPAFFTGLSGFLACAYYAPIAYRSWRDFIKELRKK